ncbi:MAG: VanW family protein [Nitrososphaerales archaeon]
MPKRQSRLGCLFPLLMTAGLLLLAAVSLLAWYQWRYNDRIYPGVSVAGVPLGGLTVKEAESAIADALTPYPGPEVTLRFGDRSWILSASDLGVSVDASVTASQAYAIGRHGLAASVAVSVGDMLGGLGQDMADQWEAMRNGVAVQPTLARDEDLQAQVVARIAEEVDVAPVEGKLIIDGLQVTGTPGRLGRQMDVEATRTALAEAVRSGAGTVIDVPWQERRPAILSVDAAVAKAKTVLGRSLVLTASTLSGRQRFSADPAQVRGWFTLTPTTMADGSVDLDIELDQEQVKAFVSGLAKQLDQKAFDGNLDWDRAAGKVVVLQTSQVGQKVDVDAGIAAVVAALGAPASAEENGAPAPQEVALPVSVVKPKIDTSRVAELGIVELVSEGTSSFRGSPPERVHNIVNAAGKFDHVVVAPGDEFSFNQNVGAVTSANGFIDALVIAGDRTAVGIGGGVCQVSTTAFRAAYNGGFPIVERWAHGYVVGWYGKPGLDASIFTPNVDFRFKNDTGHYILVKSSWNTAKGTITFSIYGTKPDRTVEISEPVISNRQPAPPPSYQEDASLKPGQIKQVDWAKEGLDAVVTRTIRYGDGKVKREQLVSKYRPWQAIFLYGPGANVPGKTSSAAD